jgi:DNA processing protein
MPAPITPLLRDLLALHLVEGLGPQRITALLEAFGSAARVRSATAAELLRVPGIGEQLSAQLAQALPRVEVEAEIAALDRFGVQLLQRGQGSYPAGLAEIPAAPLLLYSRGELLPGDARGVALVGTRHPDAYGKRLAQRLASGLAQAGVTVVSGLARGIDGLAHRAALEAGGRTLAVLAGGLSNIYPPEHRDLAEAVSQAGACLSEATLFTEPTRWRFPARNRIISGLSRVIVIVQAPTDSGALITAEHAADQGRTVMAVPGLVDAEASGGCHRLLREGAVLCRGVEDILEELDGVGGAAARPAEAAAPASPAPAPPALDPVQQSIWNLLEAGPRAGDEITQLLGIPVPQLAGVLLGLEMRRLVRRLPGNRYERVG